MNNLPWKKIAVGVTAILVIAFGVFYFTNLPARKPVAHIVDPAFGEYVSSYTAGVVNSGSKLRIMLSQDVVDSAEVGQETSVKLFSFRPSIPGKTIWLDRRTVEFQPEGRLASGQVYEVDFQLSRLLEVPKKLEVFEYTFQVPAAFDFNTTFESAFSTVM